MSPQFLAHLLTYSNQEQIMPPIKAHLPFWNILSSLLGNISLLITIIKDAIYEMISLLGTSIYFTFNGGEHLQKKI